MKAVILDLIIESTKYDVDINGLFLRSFNLLSMLYTELKQRIRSDDTADQAPVE